MDGRRLQRQLTFNELIGAITITRQEVCPFSDKHIELVNNFAKQAVIAFENTRLLNELRQRSDDLSEALEQQTATSPMLQIISRSPGELEPVFESMLANATRLCDAKFGLLNLYDGDKFCTVALYNVPSAYAETRWVETFRPPPGSGHAEVLRTKEIVHIDDLRSMTPYREGNPLLVTCSIVEQRIKALAVFADPFFFHHRDQITLLAIRYALPTIYSHREFVTSGGLISYGSDLPDVWRQAGVYTGQILNGSKPADLPIVQPVKFALVINLKAANALGLTVSPALLARADEVIE